MMVKPSEKQLNLLKEIEPWIKLDIEKPGVVFYLSFEAPKDIRKKYELYRLRYSKGNFLPIHQNDTPKQERRSTMEE